MRLGEPPAQGRRPAARPLTGRSRRDRRGRGPRGPLAPFDVPVSRTRSERFDDLVLDAVERLDRNWHDALDAIDFAVEDVPPDPPADAIDPVPLGRVETSDGGRSRAVVYRRPIEARTPDELDRAELVHDVVVELVADALGMEPERIDPDYDLGE